MLKSHEQFHSANGKRQILIANDEPHNRELLGLILGQDYELLFTGDGEETLDMIRRHRETLSMVLLDLVMPGMSGLELLRVKRDDPDIRPVPIIAVTSDQRTEAESLELGAIDTITKPYPPADLILARVRRTIELCEDRQIILFTERDALTGLYNREYFYRYAEQYDLHHPGLDMDALYLDVNHFRMLNERFGTACGDKVLRSIARNLSELVSEPDGIVSRRGADAFLVYCPHREDYRKILEAAAANTAVEEGLSGVHMRMGVYAHADKNLAVERRFDRAKNAADSVHGGCSHAIGFYDSALHEKELYHAQLIEDFHDALGGQQFEVWYQPKFDIHGDIPVLAGAEALVRWRHPAYGLVSPGDFIPLFEANGLVEELDKYVWREAAGHLRGWKDRFGFCLPVSVNISRIDMLDPGLFDTLKRLLEEFDLEPRELLLEITESAYTQDSGQIIDTVNRLRKFGFRVEMDDFGTGYSSLNMISSLPVDALKLDMQFVRGAFDGKRDTRMLEVIIEIADSLAVPIIAEGVETEEQLNALKAMGCDLVQGYYFSKPLPAMEYERFLTERRTLPGSTTLPERAGKHIIERSGELSFGKVAHALSSGYESIYYVDLISDHYVELSSQGKYEDLKIENSGANFFADTRRNIPRVVYEGDRERLMAAMRKETLVDRVTETETFSILYRLMIDGQPLYYSLKAVRASTYDRNHLVVGIRNVDHEVRGARRIGEQSGFTPDFTGLAKALSRDIESVYYVDISTGNYLSYSSDGAYSLLEKDDRGTDFFSDCQRDIQKDVYSEDWEKVASALDRKNLLSALESRKSFSMDYRLVIEGKPTYYRMKVIPAETGSFRHFIVGVSNVDAQIAEEQRLMAERQNLQSVSRIAQALAQDYFIIYYVDIETDYFIEFSASDDFSTIGIEKRGENFFELSRGNMKRFVHEEDRPIFLALFTKENILHALEKHGSFNHTYRMLIGGEVQYVMMKVSRLDERHIVIGTSNVNAEVRERQTALINSSVAQALSSDYFLIFYINTETDRYVEYHTDGADGVINAEEAGENFFRISRENILRNVIPEDVERIRPLMEKESLLALLSESGSYTVEYCLLMDGVPTYVHMKASRMMDRSDTHIVIGLRNIDARVRREREQAMALRKATELASRDALTGVKSKGVFVEAELQWDERIRTESDLAFGIAMFDLNGLKEVNDTQGHAAGDTYIRSAGAAICETFKHSPVYRIGGDEFAATLSGADYENREALLESFLAGNPERAAQGKAVVACGIAVYRPGEDNRFQDVFERADAEMYDNKRRIKEQYPTVR